MLEIYRNKNLTNAAAKTLYALMWLQNYTLKVTL